MSQNKRSYCRIRLNNSKHQILRISTLLLVFLMNKCSSCCSHNYIVSENPGLNISNEDGCFHQSLLEDTTEFRHYKQVHRYKYKHIYIDTQITSRYIYTNIYIFTQILDTQIISRYIDTFIYIYNCPTEIEKHHKSAILNLSLKKTCMNVISHQYYKTYII